MQLGVDMDGVIADFVSSAIKRVKDVWGIELTHKDVQNTLFSEVVWAKLSEEQKVLYTSPKDLYRIICPKGFFEELNPLPGAIDAIEQLARFNRIIFVTKPLEWVDCPTEKRNWLKKWLPDVDYTVMFVDKMEDKKFVHVDVMIDDDPRVIDFLTSAIPLLIEQPWNEEYRKDNREVMTMKSLKESVPYLHQMDSQLRSPYLF